MGQSGADGNGEKYRAPVRYASYSFGKRLRRRQPRPMLPWDGLPWRIPRSNLRPPQSEVEGKRNQAHPWMNRSGGGDTICEAVHILKLRGEKKPRGDKLSSERELRAEISDLPSADIVSMTMEVLERLRYIADHSSNLKGTFVRDLRLCSKMS